MDLLGKARKLESAITARVDEAAKGLARPRTREPLEIVHAILDAIDQEIEPTGRGTRVFPFNRIEVSVLAPSNEARGRLEAGAHRNQGAVRRNRTMDVFAGRRAHRSGQGRRSA